MVDGIAKPNPKAIAAQLKQNDELSVQSRAQVRKTGEAITTERLRYGQRVTVLGVSVPAIMRTPEALFARIPSRAVALIRLLSK